MAPGGIEADAQPRCCILCRKTIQQTSRDVLLPVCKAVILCQSRSQRRGVWRRDRKIPGVRTRQRQVQEPSGITVVPLVIVPKVHLHVALGDGTLETFEVARLPVQCLKRLREGRQQKIEYDFRLAPGYGGRIAACKAHGEHRFTHRQTCRHADDVVHSGWSKCLAVKGGVLDHVAACKGAFVVHATAHLPSGKVDAVQIRVGRADIAGAVHTGEGLQKVGFDLWPGVPCGQKGKSLVQPSRHRRIGIQQSCDILKDTLDCALIRFNRQKPPLYIGDCQCAFQVDVHDRNRNTFKK